MSYKLFAIFICENTSRSVFKVCSSHWSEWPLLKSLPITNAGEGVEKREPSYTVGGNVS